MGPSSILSKEVQQAGTLFDSVVSMTKNLKYGDVYLLEDCVFLWFFLPATEFLHLEGTKS